MDAALEQILEKTAGKYCFGDNVTLVRSFNFSPFALDQFYSTLAAPPLSVGILHRVGIDQFHECAPGGHYVDSPSCNFKLLPSGHGM